MECEFNGYSFCLVQPLSPKQLESLVGLLEQSDTAPVGVLGGRGSLSTGQLPGLGSVVVKHYLRGGILRRFVERHYLRLGKTRPQREFELLEKARALGVNAPRPLGYACRGRVFYQAWIFMREVAEHKRLTELALEEPDAVPPIVKNLACQVIKLVQNRILHVDLHPGNVLVDKQGGVFVVDFDKARYFRGSLLRLRDKYIWRWRRAVIKHGLPDELSEIFCLELKTQR